MFAASNADAERVKSSSRSTRASTSKGADEVRQVADFQLHDLRQELRAVGLVGVQRVTLVLAPLLEKLWSRL
jgi:hypothetical protein